MTLKESSKRYYLDQKKNCAISILLGANDYYGLNLKENDYKLVAGFGGGIGCGYICGSLAGSIAVLGKMFSDRQDFRTLCATFVKLFEQELGSKNCCDIMKTHVRTDTRCFLAVEKCACLLEKFISELK